MPYIPSPVSTLCQKNGSTDNLKLPTLTHPAADFTLSSTQTNTDYYLLEKILLYQFLRLQKMLSRLHIINAISA